MFGRAISTIILAVTCVMLVPTAASCAEGWPLEARADLLLGYGALWTSGGQACTHRGVDIKADPDAHVIAPSVGRVSFAGQVPSATQGTVGAVTIDLADGTRMTLMPLGEMSVCEGESLQAGQSVGTVAESGDASSGLPHVHVSLRRGETYLDPMLALRVPSASSTPATVPVSEPAAETGPDPRVHSASVPSADAIASPEWRSDARTPAVSGSAAQVAPVVGAETGSSTSHATVGTKAGVTVPDPGAALRAAGRAAEVAGSMPSLRLDGPRAATARVSFAMRMLASLPSFVRAMTVGIGAIFLIAIVGLAFLWPLWRRQDAVHEPCGVTPVGDDIAAAVGRW